MPATAGTGTPDSGRKGGKKHQEQGGRQQKWGAITAGTPATATITGR
jgi:hypothetical protein